MEFFSVCTSMESEWQLCYLQFARNNSMLRLSLCFDYGILSLFKPGDNNLVKGEPHGKDTNVKFFMRTEARPLAEHFTEIYPHMIYVQRYSLLPVLQILPFPSKLRSSGLLVHQFHPGSLFQLLHSPPRLSQLHPNSPHPHLSRHL